MNAADRYLAELDAHEESPRPIVAVYAALSCAASVGLGLALVGAVVLAALAIAGRAG